jgi:hypothetical protein
MRIAAKSPRRCPLGAFAAFLGRWHRNISTTHFQGRKIEQEA